jgi:hypothetical protein
LGDYKTAIDFAKKANNTTTWKKILYACVEHDQMKLAEISAK